MISQEKTGVEKKDVVLVTTSNDSESNLEEETDGSVETNTEVSESGQVEEVSGVKLLATSVSGVDMNGLRDLGDQLKEKLGEGVIVLASDCDGKVNLVAMATEEAMGKGAHAGNLIKGIAAKVGGGGGGRPNMAQAGGKNPAGIKDALTEAKTVLAQQLA